LTPSSNVCNTVCKLQPHTNHAVMAYPNYNKLQTNHAVMAYPNYNKLQTNYITKQLTTTSTTHKHFLENNSIKYD